MKLSIFSCTHWPFVFFGKTSIQILAHLLIGSFGFFLRVVGVIYIYLIRTPYQIYDLQRFSPIL